MTSPSLTRAFAHPAPYHSHWTLVTLGSSSRSSSCLPLDRLWTESGHFGVGYFLVGRLSVDFSIAVECRYYDFEGLQ